MQPRVEEFTLKLERVLGKNAVVESTIEGDQTKIIFPKELFFYPDEADLRADKAVLAKRTSEVLKELQRGKSFRLSIIAGLQEYNIDKRKVTALKNAIGITEAETGLSTNIGDQIILVVSDE